MDFILLLSQVRFLAEVGEIFLYDFAVSYLEGPGEMFLFAMISANEIFFALLNCGLGPLFLVCLLLASVTL